MIGAVRKRSLRSPSTFFPDIQSDADAAWTLLGLHLVCPLLKTLLNCSADAHNLMLELFLEVLLLLRSEVRHPSVEVPRLLLFVLRRCTSFARAYERSRLRCKSPGLQLSPCGHP